MIIQKLFSNRVSLAISTRQDGNMRAFSESENEPILVNQSKLSKALETSPDKTARVLTTYIGRSCYSEYYEINSQTIAKHCIEKAESNLVITDGLVTKSKNYALLLPLADCLGVIIYDVEQNVLGLLHSGRQNLEEDGALKFVEFLKANFNCKPEGLQVYFTPHAQNFEIFALDHAKLAEAASEQLIRAGIKADHIKCSDIDTVTNPDFPSHSAGDKTNRFAVAVRLCA